LRVAGSLSGLSANRDAPVWRQAPPTAREQGRLFHVKRKTFAPLEQRQLLERKRKLANLRHPATGEKVRRSNTSGSEMP
jgi:hypothetical protein